MFTIEIEEDTTFELGTDFLGFPILRLVTGDGDTEIVAGPPCSAQAAKIDEFIHALTILRDVSNWDSTQQLAYIDKLRSGRGHGDPDLIEYLTERWFGIQNEVTSAQAEQTAHYVH